MKIHQLIRFFLPFLILIISSCNPKSKQKDNISNEFKEIDETFDQQVKTMVYDMPLPSEIPYLLEATGVEYNGSLVNDLQKKDQYTSQSHLAALNLGIYALDVGYLSSYEKIQEALNYFSVCKEMADNVGIVEIFDIASLENFESTISNKDSLAAMINKSILETENSLRGDSQHKLASLMIIGSFIEGLYIATSIVDTYPRDLLSTASRNVILTPLMRIIVGEKTSVEETLKMLQTLEQDEFIADLTKDIKTLYSNYQSLDIEDKIKNNQSNLVLTDKNLQKITATVAKIRNKITL